MLGDHGRWACLTGEGGAMLIPPGLFPTIIDNPKSVLMDFANFHSGMFLIFVE